MKPVDEFEKGYEAGYKKGYEDGYESGHEKGFEEGYAIGHEKGLEQDSSVEEVDFDKVFGDSDEDEDDEGF